jgi:hypothetical protein
MSSKTNAIDFITQDIARSQRPRGALDGLFALGVFLVPVGLGLLLREDMKGVMEPRTLIPNLLAALFIVLLCSVVFSRNYFGNRLFKIAFSILILGLLLATDRIFFPVGGLRTLYDSSETFWRESFRCIEKGALASFVSGLWLSVFAFTLASLPGRRWRALICASAGVSGTVMLGFHCDSSSVGHVLIAHVGQGILVGVLLFVTHEFLIRSKLLRRFPSFAGKLKSLHKL